MFPLASQGKIEQRVNAHRGHGILQGCLFRGDGNADTRSVTIPTKEPLAAKYFVLAVTVSNASFLERLA